MFILNILLFLENSIAGGKASASPGAKDFMIKIVNDRSCQLSLFSPDGVSITTNGKLFFERYDIKFINESDSDLVDGKEYKQSWKVTIRNENVLVEPRKMYLGLKWARGKKTNCLFVFPFTLSSHFDDIGDLRVFVTQTNTEYPLDILEIKQRPLSLKRYKSNKLILS